LCREGDPRETFVVPAALSVRSLERDNGQGTGQEMSRLTTGISGVVALSVISCAAQLALGRDLSPTARDHGQIGRRQIDRPLSSFTSSAAVNRGAKADRAASPTGSQPAPTRTVSLRFDGFTGTSFLLRIPLVANGNRPLGVLPAKPGVHKPMVACEPVVSVLTEVARQLEPGRCVT
jgi:hypothetical protein